MSVDAAKWLALKLGLAAAFAGCLGVVGGEDAGGGGEDGGALALVGAGDPDEHVAGDVGVVVLEGFAGGVELAAQHPAQDCGDRLVCKESGVEEWCE